MATSELLPLRHRDYSAMRAWCRRLPVTIDSTRDLPSRYDGLYDSENDIVYIDRRLTYTAKRCVLIHELIHWEYDDYGHEHEHRCRRETALLLIDPLDYEIAESMYEGESFEIAEQLNVTVNVVRDWQAIAEDDPNVIRRTRALHNTDWVID